MKKNRNLKVKKLISQLKTPKGFAIAILFCIFTLIFWILRLYNFENTMVFSLDQGEHMQEVQEMVALKKPRLIGPIVGTRVVEGKGYFIGPYYYYILGVLGVIFSWNVIAITKFMLFYWFLSSLILFVWIGRKLDWLAGVLVYGIFATHPYLVQFNKMIINPNFLPLVSVFLVYFLWKALSKKENKYWFLTGIFTGIAFSFHFSILAWFILIGFIWFVGFIRRIFNIFHLIFFLIGATIGDLPYLIFDLRHNFYNFKTFIANGVNPNSDLWLTYYFSFGFLAVMFWLIALIFFFTTRRIKFLFRLLLIGAITIVLLLYNFPLPKYGITMQPGWTVTKQKYVAGIICDDKQKRNFEVATAIGDLRGFELRWWVRQCGDIPLGYDGYPFADTLYLVDWGETKSGFDLPQWEVSSIGNRKYDYSIDLGDRIWFYRFTRQ